MYCGWLFTKSLKTGTDVPRAIAGRDPKTDNL